MNLSIISSLVIQRPKPCNQRSHLFRSLDGKRFLHCIAISIDDEWLDVISVNGICEKRIKASKKSDVILIIYVSKSFPVTLIGFLENKTSVVFTVLDEAIIRIFLLMLSRKFQKISIFEGETFLSITWSL